MENTKRNKTMSEEEVESFEMSNGRKIKLVKNVDTSKLKKKEPKWYHKLFGQKPNMTSDRVRKILSDPDKCERFKEMLKEQWEKGVNPDNDRMEFDPDTRAITFKKPNKNE